MTRQAAMDADVARAVETMHHGGVILYPTDTVWGLGCDARRQDAVERLFAIKGRLPSKSMISLVGGPDWLERYSNPPALPCLEDDDRPTTLVLPGGHNLAPGLIAEDGTTALRVTREDYSHALCLAMGAPVVSTSANLAGRPTPALYSEIAPEIKGAVDYVALWRRTDDRRALPSRVARVLPNGSLEWLRK